MIFPAFEDHLPDLNTFIVGLAQSYQMGNLKSWKDLEKKVKSYFTPGRMEQVELVVPGWHKMASYAQGATLTHVLCVFLGVFRLSEFLNMTNEQQELMKWVILFHDLEKEPQPGIRDHTHAFRSAVTAAKTLPKLGFATTSQYPSLMGEWAAFTRLAVTKPAGSTGPIQDNRKLPEVLDGIERMFGHPTPAALIVKTILFHLSVDMGPWPPAAPLTGEEMSRFFDKDLVPLLRVMHLGDSEGWNMFEPDRELLRNSTLEAFERIEKTISGKRAENTG
jgi:hypothetical protein